MILVCCPLCDWSKLETKETIRNQDVTKADTLLRFWHDVPSHFRPILENLGA